MIVLPVSEIINNNHPLLLTLIIAGLAHCCDVGPVVIGGEYGCYVIGILGLGQIRQLPGGRDLADNLWSITIDLYLPAVVK